jgi:hypothetical protein
LAAVQHEIGGACGMLEQFSATGTCFSTMNGKALKLGPPGAAIQTEVLAALRRLDLLLSVAGTQ